MSLKKIARETGLLTYVWTSRPGVISLYLAPVRGVLNLLTSRALMAFSFDRFFEACTLIIGGPGSFVAVLYVALGLRTLN